MNAQKHIILWAVALFASAGVAFGQSSYTTSGQSINYKGISANHYTDGVKATNVKQSVKDGKVALEMTIDVRDGVIKTVQGMAIVPVISIEGGNGIENKSVDFPYVLVNGKNHNLMYKRRLKFEHIELMNNPPQTVLRIDNKSRGTTIQYKGEVDNDTWMSQAGLGLKLAVISPADMREFFYIPLVASAATPAPAPQVAVTVAPPQPQPQPQIIYIERPAPQPQPAPAPAPAPPAPQPEPVAVSYNPSEPDIALPQNVEVPQAVQIASTDRTVSTYQVSGAAFLDFELGSSRLRTDYRENAREIAIIQRVMGDVARNSRARVTVLEIVGYASPEGRYSTNESLASDRADALASYIQNRYGIPSGRSTVRSVAEDWRKLRQLVTSSNIPYKSQVLGVIDDNTLAPDAKESKIRRMMGGAIWSTMERTMFPQLRRVEYRIEYTVPR